VFNVPDRGISSNNYGIARRRRVQQFNRRCTAQGTDHDPAAARSTKRPFEIRSHFFSQDLAFPQRSRKVPSFNYNAQVRMGERPVLGSNIIHGHEFSAVSFNA
jgi:hypothetical protein